MTKALIIFDIDGTLFETQRVTAPAVQRTLAAHGLPVPTIEEICAFCGKPVKEYHAWLAAQCRPGTADRVIAATDLLELELVRSEGKLFDGVDHMLATLSAQGHALAVCSNAPDDYLDAVLDGHALRDRFVEVRCRGTRPVTKTDMVRELMDVIPRRPVLVIGDRHDDVEAAHANGAMSIAVRYGFGDATEFALADAEVHRVEDIPPAVAWLLDRAAARS